MKLSQAYSMTAFILLSLPSLAAEPFDFPYVKEIQGDLPESILVGEEDLPIQLRTSTCLGALAVLPRNSEFIRTHAYVRSLDTQGRLDEDKVRLRRKRVGGSESYDVFLLSFSDNGCLDDSIRLFREGSSVTFIVEAEGEKIAGKTTVSLQTSYVSRVPEEGLPRLAYSRPKRFQEIKPIQGDLPETISIGDEILPIRHRTSTCLGALLVLPSGTEFKRTHAYVRFLDKKGRPDEDKVRLRRDRVGGNETHDVHLLSFDDDGCLFNSKRLFRDGSRVDFIVEAEGERLARTMPIALTASYVWPVPKEGLRKNAYSRPDRFHEKMAVRAYMTSNVDNSLEIPQTFDLCSGYRNAHIDSLDIWNRYELMLDLHALCSRDVEKESKRPCDSLWFTRDPKRLTCRNYDLPDPVSVALRNQRWCHPEDGSKKCKVSADTRLAGAE